MYLGDYHTHTTYSHGKGSIFDNAKEAARKGLKELAITDHGLNHVVMGVSRREIDKMREECQKATEEFGVRTLLGIEANLISKDGVIDVRESEADKFDIINCGFHKAVWGNNPKQFFGFIIANDLRYYLKFLRSASAVKENTRAYIKAIERNPIDVIVHINHDMTVDPIEIARAARDNGTYMEISAKKQHVSPDVLYEMAKTGVQFIVNSDAHTVDRVGEFSLAIKNIEAAGVPLSQVVNFDALPKFKRYKREE